MIVWKRSIFFLFCLASPLPLNAIELGIKGTQFMVAGKPTFLLGISYYGALGASEEAIRKDLDELKRYGFNWIRVWVTWAAFGNDVSVVDALGRAREPFLEKLKWLMRECDRRGLIVDVTFSRGNGVTGPARLQNLEIHRRAVETVVTALKPFRNWYLDLSNERNIKDRRYTSFEDLKQLLVRVKQLDPSRLVTASHAGDISDADLREYLQTVQVDFISPHRPRNPESPDQSEEKSRAYFAMMRELGRMAPLHYQEPFRRSFGKWQPHAEDFLTDLKGAKQGGAAGWCFHNGDTRATLDGRPRRSFDLRDGRLFEQLDDAERKVLEGLKAGHVFKVMTGFGEIGLDADCGPISLSSSGFVPLTFQRGPDLLMGCAPLYQ